ncbi:MAG: hypothetical protein WCJ37_09340 [Syntrophus sp. (in: bacteria)]
MRKLLVVGVMSILIILNSSLLLTAGEWYQGGTLHKATVSGWNKASYSDKLATAADWDTTIPKIRNKVQSSGDMNTLRPYASELVQCVDKAASGMGYSNQGAAELAAGCQILMGW